MFSKKYQKVSNLSVDEMYMVLALFMLMGIVQKPTLRSYYAKNRLLFTPFSSEMFPLERLEVVMKFMHFSDNSKMNIRDLLNFSIFIPSFST
jgi:hypothetical protein